MTAHLAAVPGLFLNAECAFFNVGELCLSLGMSVHDTDRLSTIIPQRLKVKKGAVLYRAGDALRSLYAVRSGYFKTTLSSRDGREQLTGFPMSGELLGCDAISNDRHECDAIALEDSEVCPIHFSQLERLARELPSLQRNLNRVLSQEIVRDHEMLLMMGNLNAEERMAALLLDLSCRMADRGYSGTAYVLHMSREDIGSYLGLRLETICRAIGSLRSQGIVRISGRAVEILDLGRLRTLISGCERGLTTL
ncbi:helix-turn-helix domain-containing protein [Pseudomonas petrae]|uniref:Helix-turn-helix domain-containing protein n=1 Tax=Pseudomonas petrae TaxID=2912190 RepID=A0ABS9I916_9PSED|nr:helix-turn-helix domain-containing protein [Pseudomonas petrae]MCF7532721.1 helix-turn-helix domain-containing protein [Pseudomonas petrae]MCF7538862.1 helix-turn-helix domain-containing protein [Pseudomonas petrae]MCF7543721.1 helix-turn-helix domain-containing protein [Pseudomonas petrae]MCF7557094.1 helix-turn-helix domain-containing protein [Pseudomonas petrae]